MQDLVEISIGLADDVEDPTQVAGALRAQGIEVVRVLGTIGAIVARCREDQLAVVATTQGVRNVELQRTIQLPDDDAPQ